MPTTCGSPASGANAAPPLKSTSRNVTALGGCARRHREHPSHEQLALARPGGAGDERVRTVADEVESTTPSRRGRSARAGRRARRIRRQSCVGRPQGEHLGEARPRPAAGGGPRAGRAARRRRRAPSPCRWHAATPTSSNSRPRRAVVDRVCRRRRRVDPGRQLRSLRGADDEEVRPVTRQPEGQARAVVVLDRDRCGSAASHSSSRRRSDHGGRAASSCAANCSTSDRARAARPADGPTIPMPSRASTTTAQQRAATARRRTSATAARTATAARRPARDRAAPVDDNRGRPVCAAQTHRQGRGIHRVARRRASTSPARGHATRSAELARRGASRAQPRALALVAARAPLPAATRGRRRRDPGRDARHVDAAGDRRAGRRGRPPGRARRTASE